jgi:hypothetical protein
MSNREKEMQTETHSETIAELASDLLAYSLDAAIDEAGGTALDHKKALLCLHPDHASETARVLLQLTVQSIRQNAAANAEALLEHLGIPVGS